MKIRRIFKWADRGKHWTSKQTNKICQQHGGRYFLYNPDYGFVANSHFAYSDAAMWPKCVQHPKNAKVHKFCSMSAIPV